MKELQNLENQPKITKIVIDELKETTLANLEDFKFSDLSSLRCTKKILLLSCSK